MNKYLPKIFSLALILTMLLAALPARQAQAVSPDIVISQVYGGGGNSGATYTNDFIELFNRGTSIVDITGWSLQYASATGTGNFGANSGQLTPLSGSLAPGQYILIQEASNAAVGSSLPTPDITDATPINMSGSAGKVALVNSASGLGCNGGSTPCSPGQLALIVDLVGYGGANFFEGSAAAPGLSNSTSDTRAANGCTDTDDNAADFTAGAPAPRNSASPLSPCGDVTPIDDELLLTEIVVTPTGGEFVEIYNPTSSSIDLSNYYLTDATFAGGSTYYYNIVTGSNAGGGSFGDFHARFPDGASILAGEYQTIAMTGSSAFLSEYGVAPDYELFDDASSDGEQLMRESLPGSINGQGGLTNAGEVVILFSWDGESDLVTDMDYAVWGDKEEAVDKTGVAVDGPDAGSDTSSYLPDTAITSQDVLAPGSHVSGISWQRDDLTEGTETTSGGNGTNGEDETSENLSITWCENTPTPGEATVCPPPPSTNWIINEINADPDSIAGDANGDGVAQFSDDEFVEIVNNSGVDVDISGWTLSDGFGVRHTYSFGTVVPASCSVVVFGGGTPTGKFGYSAVQTASTGTLGLNNGGDNVTLFDGVSNVATVSYGGEGGDNQSLTLDPDITGSIFVKHTTATGSGGALFSPGTLVDGSQFAGCPAEKKIHEVQGNGSASPLVGQTVAIEGIVVGDFQDGASGTNGDLNGFNVQEEDADADADPLTSEGVFVYDGSSPTVNVQIGDLVQVEGVVSEFNDLTEITSFTGVTIISSGNALPTAATASLPVTRVDAFEAYEGMLVTFPQALVISEYFNFDRFNEIVLTSARHLTPTAEFEPGSPEQMQAVQDFLLDRITLDDGRTNQNPDPAIHPNGLDFDLTNLFRGGSTVANVTGVMDYAFGLYRIQPTQGADYNDANPRTDHPDDVGGSLKVASFNVLNYFTTLDNSGPICGPVADQDCRGADDANEFTRQRDKIIAALTEIDADVVGLIEIENHPADVPTADLVSGLNDAMGAGTYDYVATGAIGTDAIRVAFIYKPASVSPVGNYAILDSSVDARFDDTRSRPVLAQSFMDNSTGGFFTAAVNHLKSKSGSELDDSGAICVDNDPNNDVPDCDQGDGQGYFNATRKAAAEALVDWLAGDPTGSGDADSLIIGDLNSYDKEDPIDAILAGGFTDLIYDFHGEDAYSYVFDGQTGYLDYGMANQDLLPEITGVTAWHINADEADLIDYDTSFKGPNQDAIYAPDAYRASDHDPVIVGLELTTEAEIIELINDVQKLYDDGVLNKGQANALTSKLENVLAKLAKGNSNAAANQLGAFINQVEAFVNGDILTTEQGDLLIKAATLLVEALN